MNPISRERSKGSNSVASERRHFSPNILMRPPLKLRQVVEVANQQAVLPRLGSLVADLRRSLGESRASLQQFGVPVEQATTGSLEALKAYQLGLELRAHSRNL